MNWFIKWFKYRPQTIGETKKLSKSVFKPDLNVDFLAYKDNPNYTFDYLFELYLMGKKEWFNLVFSSVERYYYSIVSEEPKNAISQTLYLLIESLADRNISLSMEYATTIGLYNFFDYPISENLKVCAVVSSNLAYCLNKNIGVTFIHKTNYWAAKLPSIMNEYENIYRRLMK